MTVDAILAPLGLAALFLPVAAALLLGVPLLLGIRLEERTYQATVAVTFLLDLLACLGVDAMVLLHPSSKTVVTLAHWMVMPTYVVDARLVFDLPAAVLMTLTSLLCGLIAAFSASYLHQDPGFRRFFVLLLLFAAGMMAVASGDTLDLVYAGWEVVGLASALLIAYFHTRTAPVRHGLRAFAVYRLCDVALLSAAVILHHEAGDASLGGGVHLEEHSARLVALLLVFASMGKAAAFPFTGWLPRAMEGPTSSSAIFYGALSIHAGPFLLVRAWPLIEGVPEARAAIVGIGLLTAAHATMVGRVQTDIKSTLGYASVTQAGIILVEIGLGLPMLALLHITSHAILRSWQLLRAPSAQADRIALIGMIGGGRPPRGTHWERWLPVSLRRFGYRVALERWFLDDLAANGLAAGLIGALRALDRLDRRWVRTMTGVEPGADGGAS